ncbi:hypothetical protein [Saliphagus sp. LR7]|uniref:DUF7287 family protein n=1 Tax=Saliphagus sp. LR7 TaxID=2282654 RepID=UPI000DF73E2B|nr:hypothetical protein [Saliphagus sp. LR7]
MRENLPRGPRTERAQTTQDFVIGIGIFLLAVAFVFSFLPSLLSPYAPAVDGGDAAQADRVAGEVLETVEGNGTQEVNVTAFNETYGSTGSDDLAAQLGLRSSGSAIDRVNISIETLNPSKETSNRTIIGGGDTYEGSPRASSARIVRVTDLEEDCDPACRLVVRVW